MIGRNNTEIRTKNKEIKKKIPFIMDFTNELEKVILEKGNKELFYIYGCNFCNHLAIGLAYVLNKKIKGYEFSAYESHFIWHGVNFTERVKRANRLVTGLDNAYNHAYVIAKNLKTNTITLIDMQRTPIWSNMIKDISNLQCELLPLIEEGTLLLPNFRLSNSIL